MTSAVQTWIRTILVALAAAAPFAAPVAIAEGAPAKGRVVEVRSGAAFETASKASQARAAAVRPACADADLAPVGENLEAIADATLCLVNAERLERGRRALAANAKLAEAALGHVEDMVAHSYFSHDGRNGSAFTDRIRATGYLRGAREWFAGENLAWGTGVLATPREIVQAWMESPGHRANILEPDFREIGIGIVVGNPVKQDGLGATYGTEFGTVSRAAPRRSDTLKRSSKRGKRRG